MTGPYREQMIREGEGRGGDRERGEGGREECMQLGLTIQAQGLGNWKNVVVRESCGEYYFVRGCSCCLICFIVAVSTADSLISAPVLYISPLPFFICSDRLQMTEGWIWNVAFSFTQFVQLTILSNPFCITSVQIKIHLSLISLLLDSKLAQCALKE